ncbi:MAG: hypothetical protein GYA15_01050 [Leptolinea sp.]|jgi:16S rRNA (guanine(1405)-N(7))-methyltransferase|nr:hypothetical protein [Leptolinea sp.]
MKETDPATLARVILTGRKYRHLDIPPETVIDLIQHGLDAGLRPEQAVDIAREKLHNIVAPYLGDPDYEKASREVGKFDAFSDDKPLRNFCLTMLESHASTRERIPYLSDFYWKIFTVTGVPRTILDLACAMHPFGIPWMGLPAGTRYQAYDLHRPRVELINHFFTAAGICGEAIYGDILLNPPAQPSDVGFFFKEAHRFEQRQKGCNRAFWQALNVRWLVVSLPASNLTGRFDLADRQRRLVSEILTGIGWPVTEILVGNELIFCLRKENV